ncbi:hypothetical protein FCG18_12010, partial [Neisseria meningitidis]|nr:hypothetical protein [Neisseria meningitidis]
PQKRESSNRKTTGIYQQKQKPPPPSFPRRRESSNTTRQDFIGKNRNPTAVIPAKAGIQTRRHGNLPDKTVSLDSTS